MSELRIGSLCTGYGGMEIAVAEVLGGDIAWVADNDPGVRRVLAHRFPDVPNIGDITTAEWEAFNGVDVVTAGFPCQPVSHAGKRLGEADERWIWGDVARAVRDLRPRVVYLENVSALLVRGFGRVLADLAEIGYVGSWTCIRASDVGAPHRRERVFIVAQPAQDPDVAACDQRRQSRPSEAQVGGAWSDPGRRGRASTADAVGGGWDGRSPDTQRRPVRRVASAGGGESGHRRQPAADPDGDGRERQPQRHLRPETRLRTPLGDDVERRVLDWGPYGHAIRRWETIVGRAAPAPAERGRTGQRLSPRFVEWLMGLEPGWVTDVSGLTRNQQLAILGNGVVPQQAAAALRMLLATELEDAA